MKHIFVRPSVPDDSLKFVAWRNGNHAFDKDILPFCQVLTAYDDHGPLAFLPVQTPLFMEAMTFRPESSDVERALAMKELCHTAITLCAAARAGEVYFLGSDERTNAFAVRQGFEELPWKAYRMRLSKLEGK